jgi:hypothetical protein
LAFELTLCRSSAIVLCTIGIVDPLLQPLPDGCF